MRRRRLWIVLFSFMLLCSISTSVSSDDPKIGEGTLIPCCPIVNVGEEFDITLFIDTNYETYGFTLRQLTFEGNLADIVNISFSSIWYDEVFNDPGHLDNNVGNLSYLMTNKFTGVTGYNPAVTFTFLALQPGELHLIIPSHIWSGQSGLEIDLADVTTWNNISITIDVAGENHRPVISNPSPENGKTDVSKSLNKLSVLVEDIDGDTFDWEIKTSPDIGNNSGTGTDGIKTNSISGLSYSTTYIWYVNATDGILEKNVIYTFTVEDKPGDGTNDDDTPPPLNENPVANPGGPYNGTVNETITFNASGSADDGSIDNYTWYFGDNNTGYNMVVDHIYNKTGNFTVVLVVTDNLGAVGESSTYVTINLTDIEPNDEPPDDDEPVDEHDDNTNNTSPDNETNGEIPQNNNDSVIIYAIIIVVIIIAAVLILKSRLRI